MTKTFLADLCKSAGLEMLQIIQTDVNGHVWAHSCCAHHFVVNMLTSEESVPLLLAMSGARQDERYKIDEQARERRISKDQMEAGKRVDYKYKVDQEQETERQGQQYTSDQLEAGKRVDYQYKIDQEQVTELKGQQYRSDQLEAGKRVDYQYKVDQEQVTELQGQHYTSDQLEAGKRVDYKYKIDQEQVQDNEMSRYRIDTQAKTQLLVMKMYLESGNMAPDTHNVVSFLSAATNEIGGLASANKLRLVSGEIVAPDVKSDVQVTTVKRSSSRCGCC